MISNNSRFHKRKKELFENVIAGTVFIGILAAIIGFFLYQNIATYQRRAELEGRLHELQAQVVQLSQEQAVLEGAIEDSQTEEQIERALREQGLYKREGEEVVTVLPAEEGMEEVAEESPEKDRVWWQPWTWF